MGQNQSSEKPSASRSGTPQDKDKKVGRKKSVQVLPHSRSSPADASASNAVAQGTTSHNSDRIQLQHMLQQTSPELASRASRSTSRTAKDRQEIIRPQQTPSPAQSLPVAQTVPSEGINIPSSSTSLARTRQEDLESHQEPIYAPVSHHRPPRLPLPIAEVPTPDSPQLAPVDRSNADIPIFDTDDALAPVVGYGRRNSMLSVATQDEDEVGEELQPYGVGFTGQTVPTVIEWNKPAEKVFVTGTFAAWDKKYRLRKSESNEGRFKTIINLPPGTHHLKFFVDNQMITSDDLPTAVDFNNILVNYLEISTDDIPDNRRDSTQPTKGMNIQSPSQHPLQDSREDEHSGTATPGGDDDEAVDKPPIEEMPEGDFRQLIPQALTDVDLSEDDPRYKQAAQVIQEAPAPPSLPLFLSRSILNGNLPIKDDSSVLALPNHTVLNHLMTSSVRNGVLATSVTTRYKKKYVTTISFKPVPRVSSN